ncbi:MAG: TonB-dependent receptor, partial [Acidobacteria bacterium]|nr:TonB-dependent receptor [Acidobacteriota bacterium]
MAPITSLERYRRTLLFLEQGLTPEEIRSLGGGATQFSLNSGDPLAGVSQHDLGLYFLDDWRVRRNFTLSLGLRYETQNNISDWRDWAPRVGFAWAPGGGQQSKTVVRGGSGIFYDRINRNLTLQTLRFNGSNQLQYIVQNPDFYPLVPSPEDLAGQLAPQVIRVMSPDTRAPYMLHSAIGIERQLPWNTTVAATYTNSRSFHLLRSVSLDALTGAGAPISGAADVFQYETTGIFRQNQLIFNVRSRFHPRVSLFGFYALNKAMSDTDGAGSFPANPFDLRADYGRSSEDVRHRVFLGGSVTAPVGLRFNPFIILQSGRPFNLTTGTDNNSDLIFSDRPAFATDPSDPDVVVTELGAFDTTPDSGASLVPRNFGAGPSLTAVNLRLSKTWGFGASRASSADAGQGGGATGDMIMMGGGRGRGRRGGWRRGEENGKRYALTFSVSARNILNITNPGTPIGNLSSPLFGESNSSAGFGRGGNAGNRTLMLQLRFSF